MAGGKRKHPTESMGVMSEINTVHAFGPQGRETNGWPYRATSVIGTPIGPRLYRPPRLSQNELGGSTRTRRKTRRRKHATQSLGAK